MAGLVSSASGSRLEAEFRHFVRSVQSLCSQKLLQQQADVMEELKIR